MNKRLAILASRSKVGHVPDYVYTYIRGLQQVGCRVQVMIQGSLNEQSKNRLIKNGVSVKTVSGRFFDFQTWREGLRALGWENLSSFDEVILCNDSMYGPVYPFSETFEKMESCSCDFWALSSHPASPRLLLKNDAEARLHEHLQTYFLVIRKSMLKHKRFQHYWDTLKDVANRDEEFAYHEVMFTSEMQKLGFSCGSLMDAKRYTELCPNADATMWCPERLLDDYRFPLVNKKLFTTSWRHWINLRAGFHPRTVMECIKQNSEQLYLSIWEDLLTNQKMSDIKDALHLNYILPSEVVLHKGKTNNSSVAVLCYAYYPDLAERICSYITNAPDNVQIYIISSRQDTLDEYKRILSDTQYKNIDFRLKANRGRDIAAFLVDGRDVYSKHDLVCCVHDKKSKPASPLFAEDFMWHCLECCLGSKAYIENLINLFEGDPACGLLVPPTVYYAELRTLAAECSGNEEIMNELLTRLKLTCPKDDTPVAPFGSCFWIRGEAMQPMFNYDWQIEDFPPEPMPGNYTVSHGIERIFPFVAQTAGYYSAWCSPDNFASLYMNSMSFKMRENNKVLYQIYGEYGWPRILSNLRKLPQELENLKSPENEIIRLQTKLRKYEEQESKQIDRKIRKIKRKYRFLDIMTFGVFHKLLKKKRYMAYKNYNR